MRFDPGMIFDQVANGRSSIAISEIPTRGRDPAQQQAQQERLQQWAAQNGITNGQLTRDQFMRYMEERMAQFAAMRAQGGGGRGGLTPGAPPAPGTAPTVPPGGGVPPTDGTIPQGVPVPPLEEEEKPPTYHRPGKLPKGLPDWFVRLDTDKDGQIGLYEWKEAGRSLEEFRKLDRNGDGFITVEEALHSVKGPGNSATASTGGSGRGGDDSAEESSSTRSASAAPASNSPGGDRSMRRGNGNGNRQWNNNRRFNRPPANGTQGGGNQNNGGQDDQ
jgi:hypothetical protein